VKLNIIMSVSSIVVSERLYLEQLNVKITFPSWGLRKEDLYTSTWRFLTRREKEYGVQIKYKLVSFETSSKTMVQEVSNLHAQ